MSVAIPIRMTSRWPGYERFCPVGRTGDVDELLGQPSADTGTVKGENGRVGVVAGSIDYAGPPALAGTSTLRTGSDVVRVLTSETVLDVVASHSPNLLTSRHTRDHLREGVGEQGHDPRGVERRSRRRSRAVRTPPGSYRGDRRDGRVPLVVDADAIVPVLDADFGEAVFAPDTAERREIEGQLRVPRRVLGRDGRGGGLDGRRRPDARRRAKLGERDRHAR